MQTIMAVEDVKMTLPELLDTLAPGDEVILTRNQQGTLKSANRGWEDDSDLDVYEQFRKKP